MKKQLAVAAFSLLIPLSQAPNANDNDALKKDSIDKRVPKGSPIELIEKETID